MSTERPRMPQGTGEPGRSTPGETPDENSCQGSSARGSTLFQAGHRSAALSSGWAHCSPELLHAGMHCPSAPRRVCQCSHGIGHDHLVDASWFEQLHGAQAKPSTVPENPPAALASPLSREELEMLHWSMTTLGPRSANNQAVMVNAVALERVFEAARSGIDALAENEQLRREIGPLNETLRDFNNQLQGALADRDRLDWLAGMGVVVRNGRPGITVGDVVPVASDQIRAAIDRAMQCSGQLQPGGEG